MMNIQATRYHVKDGYLVENIAEKYVLVAPAIGDIDYSKMIVLSESAAFVINHLINKSLSFDELLKLLLDEYEVEKELVTKELTELIDEFKNLNILEIQD